jgi:hypothetical protein
MVVSIFSSSQFSPLPQLPHKIELASKVVKIDSKIIILLTGSKSVKLTVCFKLTYLKHASINLTLTNINKWPGLVKSSFYQNIGSQNCFTRPSGSSANFTDVTLDFLLRCKSYDFISFFFHFRTNLSNPYFLQKSM